MLPLWMIVLGLVAILLNLGAVYTAYLQDSFVRMIAHAALALWLTIILVTKGG